MEHYQLCLHSERKLLLYNFRTSRTRARRLAGREAASWWTGLLVDCGLLCYPHCCDYRGLFQEKADGVGTHQKELLNKPKLFFAEGTNLEMIYRAETAQHHCTSFV